MVKLKSTGQEVFILDYIGTGSQPWPVGYKRVLIPNDNGKNHTQIVKETNLKQVSLSLV